jgi:hypothetical protein
MNRELMNVIYHGQKTSMVKKFQSNHVLGSTLSKSTSLARMRSSSEDYVQSVERT